MTEIAYTIYKILDKVLERIIVKGFSQYTIGTLFDNKFRKKRYNKNIQVKINSYNRRRFPFRFTNFKRQRVVISSND